MCHHRDRMLNAPDGHFIEATAVWVGCVLAFILVILLRRAWIQRAKTRKAADRRMGAPLEEHQ